jgi:phosphomannomutase
LPARFTASDRLTSFPTELSAVRIAAMATSPEAAEDQFPELGRPVDIDTTDGLRMTFANDEIVHLRPSGNAPELRCYTEAASASRARALNQACLARLESWRT